MYSLRLQARAELERRRRGLTAPHSTSPEAQARLASWQDDPVLFAREALGIECWSRQAELARTIALHDRVACRSGHKVAKSCTAALIAIWWSITRDQARSIILAPTGRQVKEIIWRELRILRAHASLSLGGELHLDPGTGWRFDGERQIIGVSTDEAERLGGFSGPNLLFIADEASGIADEHFEAIAGNLAGGAKLVLLGNPTRVTGQFYRAFHQERSQWQCLHISSEESPNVTGERTIPGLATTEWIEEMKAKWGRESNWYRVRVLGEFPESNEDSLIPLPWIERAVENWRRLEREGKLPEPALLALDVAGGTGRDAGVIAAANGLTICSLWHSTEADTMEQTGRMYQGYLRGMNLVVDADGLGAAVVHRLRELGAIVEAYQGSEATDQRDESGELSFPNVRSASWWRARDVLDPANGYEPALPPDDGLIEDLLSARYKVMSNGKVQLESKEVIRKRLHRSPDKGDAVVMAWSQWARHAPLPDLSPVV